MHIVLNCAYFDIFITPLDVELYTDSGNSYGNAEDTETFTCRYSNFSELTTVASIFWGSEELTSIDISARLGNTTVF